MTATDDLKASVISTNANMELVVAGADKVKQKADAVKVATQALAAAHDEFRAALIEMAEAAGNE